MSATAYVCRQFVEDVTAYLEGTMPDDLAAVVEAHLAHCPHCREYLREMRLTIAVTGILADDEVARMPADVRRGLLDAFARPEER